MADISLPIGFGLILITIAAALFLLKKKQPKPETKQEVPSDLVPIAKISSASLIENPELEKKVIILQREFKILAAEQERLRAAMEIKKPKEITKAIILDDNPLSVACYLEEQKKAVIKQKKKRIAETSAKQAEKEFAKQEETKAAEQEGQEAESL